MASYKSGFDPPPRPGPADSRGRRLGTYIQSGRIQDPNEADIAHTSGQLEPRRGYTHPQPSRIQQTIPRPSMRSPSPSTRAMTEPRTVGTGSRFGFGKPSVPVSTPAPTRQALPVPELKGKSSRNVLRRKQSSVAQAPGNPRSAAERSGSTSPSKWSQVSAENRPSIEASLKSAEAYNEIYTRNRTKTPVNTDSPRIIPELDRYRTGQEQSPGRIDLPPKLSTTDLPPPTPLLSGTPLYSGSGSSHHRYSGYSGSGYSASPSTRFSESPGPGAAYSRDTTPTSMSSQSPGIIAPLKPITPRLRQGSPAQTRPPVTRRRAGSNANDSDGPVIDPHGLPSLRESLTSSSSNSTVKGEKKAEDTKEKKKKKRLSPLPPSPPPRKSSQKFKKPRSDTQESPSKASQAPAKPVMVSPVKAAPAKKPTAAPIQTRNIPPARPSREGAPDLQSPAGESIAVIQSNLSGITFSQDRRQSGLLRGSPLQPQGPRSTQGSRLPSRNPSPSPIQPSPRLGTPAPAGLGIVPDLRPHPATLSKGSGLRTPSPSTATKPRFGLFGRRTKTAPEVPTVDTVKEKVVRKGPAAGTGHEGYGRYSARGRSTSAGGIGRGRERSMSAASSSQDSISSTVTHDPFLLERMSPVIIAGGEVIENRNASSELSRTESNTSLLLDRGRPSIESKGSSKSSLGQELSRNTLWPSALPKEPAKRGSMLAVPKGRRPSDSSDDVVTKSSLAFRRSIQRLNNSTTALQLPKPLNIPSAGPGSSMTSLDNSIMSNDSQQEISAEQRGRKVLITKSKKLEKRPKSPRKWNFFHRSQPKTEPKPEPSVPVTVGRPPVKPIPHYALLDGSSDEMPDYMEGMDLEDILRDAEVVDLSNEELDLLQFGEMKANLQRERDQKMKEAKAQEEKLPPLLFASPEPMQTPLEMPQKELHLTKDAAPIRPSRLPQVGRIPKVVSARPQATSPKSFSRPFARLSLVQPLPSPIVVDKESIALGASPPKGSTPISEPPRMDLQAAIVADMRKGSLDSRSDVPARNSTTDFLAFSPPRKGSETTTSSSGGLSFVGTTAVIPEPDAELAEDEVWDEYDDLIETSDPTKDIPVPVSATSSHGVPFQYESYESRRMRKSKTQLVPKESPTLTSAPKIGELKIDTKDQTRGSFLTSSSVYSTDLSPRVKDSLAALPSPQTPLSFSDFFSGYGDRNNSISNTPAKSTAETSAIPHPQEEIQTRPRKNSRSKSNDSSSGSGSNGHKRSLSGLMTISEQTHYESSLTPIEQVNLRVGSMTVSKWLTFGHVLFSPGREVVSGGSAKRQSVLVIDGLGNDDWSFYASETYPHLKINNLSPTSPPPSSSSFPPTASTFPLTPPNHQQIQHPHLSTPAPFPFPSSTFSIVVFRFPPSLPRNSYSHVISEARRVLVPGGYLELAVLDLDMVNMGPRCRRSVRGVKMRLAGESDGNGSNQEKWTGSAADMVLRLVGEKGFVSVKSCCVGVPVASLVSRPLDVQSNLTAQSSSTWSRDQNAAPGSRTRDAKGKGIETGGRELKEERSLADLMKSPSSDLEADEGIAKMVSRVGRWWYERCYEDGNSPSIFDDENLMRECEEWNSSLSYWLLMLGSRLLRGGGP